MGRKALHANTGKGSELPPSVLYYRFVLDSLPVAVITVDAELRITGFNPWAEQVTGYSKEEAVGRFCGEILQGRLCDTGCPLKTVLGQEHRILRLETTIRNKGGQPIPVRINTAGLFDEDGVLVGGLEAFQDISELKKVQRDKDNLVSMFAHDLKSSVVIMGGFARRLLANATKDDSKRTQHLEIIKKEADKLESLTNEFLEFSRLESERLTLDPSATSLKEELAELVESHRLQAATANIKVILETEPGPCIIQADANRLRRVFSNLLDNALKYSKPGTSVTLSVGNTGPELVVRIRDQGRGIDPEDLPCIFDPFHRAAGAKNREGFGLGLATVKAIVDAHGGRVHVESELGKGSTFTVVLPKAGPEVGPSPSEDRDRDV
jgi:PAS domain S-box-containing protein